MGEQPPRVIVTGSRDWDDRVAIYDMLCRTYVRFARPFVLVHGKCPTGADKIADEIGKADRSGMIADIDPWPADWKAYGKSAGPRRNSAMVDAGAERCLAFILNLSTGTCDCVRKAMTAGISVDRIVRFEPQRMTRRR